MNNGEILAEKHSFSTGFARYFDSELEKLYCGLKEFKIGSRKRFNSLVSEIFDRVYKYTPTIQNEILTTFKKSGNVTRIVRKVVRHLLEGEPIKETSKEALIIKELFHSDDIKIRNIKDEIEKFIHLAGERRNLNDLYDKLTRPPFGLTRQIISLLLLDMLLKHGDRASIFEKGLFQLEITPLLFDRLMVNPAKFEVQKNVFTDDKKYYLENLSKILGEETDNLLELTKTLVYKIRGLDKYTKNTEKLSKPTIKLRNTVLNAKEPYKLIFNDIPIALGFKDYKNCNNKFFNLLSKSFQELESNYSALLNTIEQFLSDSFKLKPGEKIRNTLLNKINVIDEFIADDDLNIIANNIKIENLTDERWIERLATVINKKNVPKNWTDGDLADFKQKVVFILNEIKRLEIISSHIKPDETIIEIDNELKSIIETINGLSKLKKLMLLTVLREKMS